MSTTMIVCLIIIGICTLVIIVSHVYELIQTAKLEEANKLLSDFVPKGNIMDDNASQLKVCILNNKLEVLFKEEIDPE